MPGFTAYAGLLKIGEPKAGETVVVASASGPVGGTVGQIAKLKGCRVVGVAGGAEKCAHVVENLGFDACIDHRADDWSLQQWEQPLLWTHSHFRYPSCHHLLHWRKKHSGQT